MGNGYSVVFEDNACVIGDKITQNIIVKVYMAPNTLLPLEMSSVENRAHTIKECSESTL